MDVAPIEVSPGTEIPNTELTPAPVADPQAEAQKNRLLHLARQEKANRAQAKAIKDKEAAIAAREAEIQSIHGWKQNLTKDPLKVLQDAGISYDQLTQLMLNQPSAEAQALRTVEERLQGMEQKQKSVEQLIKENEQKQYDQALKQISSEVQNLSKLESDNYELINAYKAHEAVVELIKWTFENEGYLPTIEDAMKEVEEHLMEEALLIAKSKKITSKLSPPAPEELPVPPTRSAGPSIQPRPIPQRPTPERTLNHQSAPPAPSGKLTARDRRERAILAFQGKI